MHPFKNAVTVVLLLLAMGCTEGKPPHSQSWKQATGAEAHERLFWKAIEDADFVSAERRLAPIYTLTTADGIADRDKAIEYFRSRGVKHIDMAELRVEPQGPDMVVSYVATVQTGSSEAPQRSYMTTVWQQVKRGWIAILHTEVPAAAQRPVGAP
jgi:hypothetical protein